MDGYISAREASQKLGYDYSYFTTLLKDDRVPGAFQWQRTWAVPEGVTREEVERPVGRPVERPRKG
jgi:hypothetical protein